MSDSIHSHDSSPKQPEKQKSRRPPNTAFRQQRLKAWQPILTPKTVLPLFFSIGIIFAPIGGLLLYASSQVQEIKLDYTRCLQDGGDFTNSEFVPMPGNAVQTAFKNNNGSVNAKWAAEKNVNITLYNGVETTGDRCYLQFTTPERMGAPVLLYYHLTNFYQNHRRYAESCDLSQLRGDARSYGDITGSKCTPLYGADSDGTNKPYYPCGLIANSMFNDSIGDPMWLSAPGSKDPKPYNMTKKGIAWDSDKDLYGKTSYKPSDILPPPNWAKAYPENYTEQNPPPNIREWEAFQVWMRTAGLPTFSKLYKRNDDTPMDAGTYQIAIDDFFPTEKYEGTKSVLITTRTVMGGRNNFLGIAYIAVGGVCILLGAIFTATHLIRPRKLGDHTYLSWNNAPASKPGPSTGTASGRDVRPNDS
ncbi:hypothetical protein E4U52_005160 [Claviceps spartinae]|nr:hypothetical protein E4U52_005160 [Claviceps spartinae]KAG6084810.1 hypothetical protein E4U15_001472 [Claviceps sp. LM218 group G6]KAG6093274.1 hypothetical protein E4U30_004478 [Claviceps sp. LM220 group G6]KAG6097566.1 hypothetical protein E4U14_007703 [Claviceps sp. LM454 group G7]KAG6105490.1 hypothetical protein E4U31_001395 [Claviceps sp. LM219 group G6]